MSIAMAAPAHAVITLTSPNGPDQGENIVFNKPDAINEGAQVRGHTNQTNIAYLFEGTTTNPGPTNVNWLVASGGLGQATIEAWEGNRTDTFLITSLNWFREDGGLFDYTEFNLDKVVADSVITMFAWDQDNDLHNLGQLTLGGTNRFAVEADGTIDHLLKVGYVVDSPGGVDSHKQTRVENFIPGGGGNNPPGAVPEPATWAMMLLGFGAIGAAMRRRRQSVGLRVA